MITGGTFSAKATVEASTLVLRACDELERAGIKMGSNSNSEMQTELGKNKSQIFRSLGDGLYRKGNRIYVRDQSGGSCTWRSTKTNQPAQARKWKERREHLQWMHQQPVVCGKAEGASPFGSANFRASREADSQGFGIAFLHSGVP